MKLFTLFISYRFGGHYCGVYVSLEYLHDVIKEMAGDTDIRRSEVPKLAEIRERMEQFDDYYWEFSDSTWIQIQETSEQLVDIIKKELVGEAAAAMPV